MTFIPFSVSLSNYIIDIIFHGVGMAGIKSMANAFLLTLRHAPFETSNILSFHLSPCAMVVFLGLGSSDRWGIYQTLPALYLFE